jgi:hypothetical protein
MMAVLAVILIGAGGIVFARSATSKSNALPMSSATCATLAGIVSVSGTASADDARSTVSTGRLAPLPVSGLRDVQVRGVGHYATATLYRNNTILDGPSLWATTMQTDGFAGATAIGYQSADDAWGAEALGFGTHAGAEAFFRATIAQSCSFGYLSDPTPIPGVPGGVGYTYRYRDKPPYSAEFVAGDTVVHLNICECVRPRDSEGLAVSWAQAVGRQLTSS